MTRKLVVLMDAGRFKAYRWEDSDQFSQPRLVLLEDWETEVNDRMSEALTDQAGAFQKGGRSFSAANDMSNGERHNIDLERRRRALRRMADRVAELLEDPGLQGCYLAAPREINNSVMNSIARGVRQKVEKNVAADLTRLGAPELIRQFSA